MKHECEFCGEKVEEADLIERRRVHDGRTIHVYWVCWECHLCYERSVYQNNQTWFATSPSTLRVRNIPLPVR